MNEHNDGGRAIDLEALMSHIETAFEEFGRALDDHALVTALGPGDPDGIRLALANTLGDQTNARIARSRVRARFVDDD